MKKACILLLSPQNRIQIEGAIKDTAAQDESCRVKHKIDKKRLNDLAQEYMRKHAVTPEGR